MDKGLHPTHRVALGLLGPIALWLLLHRCDCTDVITTSSPAKKRDPTKPSLQTLSNGISNSKPENEFPCPHAITDCPALSFFTVACSDQVSVQVTITTCHGMDTPMSYGQADRIKSSFLRNFDPRFGPVSCHYSLSSLSGFLNHCYHAEVVDSVDWAAGVVSKHWNYYHLNNLHANDFHATAVM